MIFVFAGFVLLIIELFMLSMVLSQKQQLLDAEDRNPQWWEKLVVLYHLPAIVLISVFSGAERGRYWVALVVTFCSYLGIFIATLLLGIRFLDWHIPPNMLGGF
jgi:hypothetical protein